MRARRLRLRDVRNHRLSDVRCAPRFNVFVGGNGAGKTSILEAVALCAWTRSFVPSPGNADARITRRGGEGYGVDGEFETDAGATLHVGVEYLAAGEKRVAVDGHQLVSFARHIGAVPLVTLTPDDRSITMGAPVERRQWLDVLLSQARRGYLDALSGFRRALRQRNAVLVEARRGSSGARASLPAWTAGIAVEAAKVYAYRAAFLRDFAGYVEEAHAAVAATNESVVATYVPNVAGDANMSADDWNAAVTDAFASRQDEELARGTTVTGPHRDDIMIALNGVEARLGASQGQHKSLLVALKLAAWKFLHEVLGERPMFVLDDLFSELDPARSARFVGALCDCGQVFISTVDDGESMCVRSVFDGAVDAVFGVREGTVTHE